MAKEASKSNKEKKEKSDFFKEFKAELKRVSWPTFKQLVNNTFAVLTIVVIIAVTVFVLDLIFENLNKFGVEKLKALVTSSSSESSETNDASSEGNVGSDASNEAEESLVVENDAKATTNETDISNTEVTSEAQNATETETKATTN